MFIHNLDNNRYEQLKNDQHNSFLVGKFIYTDTLTNANKLLEEWTGVEKKSDKQKKPKEESGVVFVNWGI